MPPVPSVPSLPSPAWASPCGRATLYLGDCRQLLSRLRFDHIVTDPPPLFACGKRRRFGTQDTMRQARATMASNTKKPMRHE
jgi:hypothetical protein